MPGTLQWCYICVYAHQNHFKMIRTIRSVAFLLSPIRVTESVDVTFWRCSHFVDFAEQAIRIVLNKLSSIQSAAHHLNPSNNRKKKVRVV